MEVSTEENEAIVREVCEQVEKATHTSNQVEPYQQVIYDIDY